MLSMVRDGKSVMRKFGLPGTFENRTSYLQTIALVGIERRCRLAKTHSRLNQSTGAVASRLQNRVLQMLVNMPSIRDSKTRVGLAIS